MNYHKTIDFLFTSLPMYQRLGKAAYKENLDNTIALDNALGHPHRNFKTVHIAGTNGKGSVCHMLASILQTTGYKTGLYTSPHLLDFRERIRVDGKMISEENVVGFVEKIKKEIDEIAPSFFEMTVAMAFDHFSREKVDIAIIETGMGGRLDSTNIIEPELSVITNISLDHTEFLGNTKQLIAAEKGGIIKKNTPVVVGENTAEVIEVLTQISSERKSSISLSGKIRTFKYQTITLDQLSLFHFYNEETNAEEIIKSDLGGSYQSENIALVLSAVDHLKKKSWSISKENISSGLATVKKNTSLKGRWDIIGANPRIICDTAHNEAGIKSVVHQLNQLPSKNLHIVWGMVGDKDSESIFPLLPVDALYYFTQASIPRAMSVQKLAGKAKEAGLKGNSFDTVEAAYHSALKMAKPEDTVFIGGSTFVVADLFHFLD